MSAFLLHGALHGRPRRLRKATGEHNYTRKLHLLNFGIPKMSTTQRSYIHTTHTHLFRVSLLALHLIN